MDARIETMFGNIMYLVRRKGYSSCLEFVEHQKNKSFGQLFGILRAESRLSNSTEIGMREFIEAYYYDSLKKNVLQAAYSEAVARTIQEYLPKGWSTGKKSALQRLKAKCMVPTPALINDIDFKTWNSMNEYVWKQLEVSPLPEEWIPQNGSDPLLSMAIRQCWNRVIDIP